MCLRDAKANKKEQGAQVRDVCCYEGAAGEELGVVGVGPIFAESVLPVGGGFWGPVGIFQ